MWPKNLCRVAFSSSDFEIEIVLTDGSVLWPNDETSYFIALWRVLKGIWVYQTASPNTAEIQFPAVLWSDGLRFTPHSIISLRILKMWILILDTLIMSFSNNWPGLTLSRTKFFNSENSARMAVRDDHAMVNVSMTVWLFRTLVFAQYEHLNSWSEHSWSL